MSYDPKKHNRRSIRLDGYEYRQAGIYHITIVTHHREALLGSILHTTVVLSPFGEIVQRTWHALAERYAYLSLDTLVVMPDHVHVLLNLHPTRSYLETVPAAPNRPNGTQRTSVSAVVQNAKSTSARRINALRGLPGEALWQRNYYERIVRSAEQLERTRAYLLANPARWFE